MDAEKSTASNPTALGIWTRGKMVKEEKPIMSTQACQLSYPAASLSRVNAGHLEVQRSDGLGVHVELNGVK